MSTHNYSFLFTKCHCGLLGFTHKNDLQKVCRDITITLQNINTYRKNSHNFLIMKLGKAPSIPATAMTQFAR